MKRLIILSVTAILIAAAAASVAVYVRAERWSGTMYEPLVELNTVPLRDQSTGIHASASSSEQSADTPHVEVQPQIDNRQPFTALLIGVDKRNGDKGRADSLMLAAVNPQKRSTVVVSIPRDTRTMIAGIHHKDKINHAYAYEGVAGTVETVEKAFGVHIDYYMKVDMEGFREAIDLIGGVKVHNQMAFRYEGFEFAQGDLELDGEQALAYVRMRYDDPRGDIGRTERQRSVLRAIIDHMMDVKGIVKLSSLFDELSDHVRTNIDFDGWKTLIFHYRDAVETIRIETITGKGVMINGIYYYEVAEEEFQRIGAIISEDGGGS